MKGKVFVISICLLAGAILAACRGGTPTPDLEATKQAAVASTQASQPTDTPVPPTDTPTPTDTPVPPTDTPTPTDTPMPPTDTPTPTDTPVPPTDTPTPTATPTPAATATTIATSPPAPTATPTGVSMADSPLDINWSEQMNYEGNVGESRWCQISATYTNNAAYDVDWPKYRPAFLLVNADGSSVQWYLANYYQKSQGWPTGIEGTPPPIPAGTSADWTWYITTDRAGQYCAIVAVAVQDWVYAAHYDAKGRLAETEILPPE